MGLLDITGISRRQADARYPRADGISALLSPLFYDASAVLNLIGDSTGNSDDEWFYRLAAEKIGPAIPNACIRYASWDDANQIYGVWRTIQAGGGERSAVIKNGQPTYYSTKNADLLARSSADLEVIIKAKLADWTPAAQKRLAWINGAAGSRSWSVYLTTAGEIMLLWSPDGTATVTATSAAGSFIDGTTYSIRVRLDVDNGSGGYTVSIHKSTDEGATWTGLLNSVTAAGTTAVFNASADLNIGSDNGSINSFDGNIYRVDVNDGLNGPRRNPVEIEAFTSIDTNSSNVNEYAGAPTLYCLNGSNPGSGLSYFSDAARVKRMASYAMRSLIMLSTCHNDYQTGIGSTYFTAWQSFVAGVRGASPCASLCILNQNPRYTGIALGILYEQIFRAHAHQLPVIAQRLGVDFIDTYRAFQDAVNAGASMAALVSDGVHPTIPGGQNVWLEAVWSYFRLAAKAN